MTLHYFAYGSNMLLERLRERCPSANVRGVASVANWTVTLSKRSRHGCGVATLEHAPGRRVHGVVFDLEDREQSKLDKAEGLGYGYERDETFSVQLAGSGDTVEAFTYIADPVHKDANLK